MQALTADSCNQSIHSDSLSVYSFLSNSPTSTTSTQIWIGNVAGIYPPGFRVPRVSPTEHLQPISFTPLTGERAPSLQSLRPALKLNLDERLKLDSKVLASFAHYRAILLEEELQTQNANLSTPLSLQPAPRAHA